MRWAKWVLVIDYFIGHPYRIKLAVFGFVALIALLVVVAQWKQKRDETGLVGKKYKDALETRRREALTEEQLQIESQSMNPLQYPPNWPEIIEEFRKEWIAERNN